MGACGVADVVQKPSESLCPVQPIRDMRSSAAGAFGYALTLRAREHSNVCKPCSIHWNQRATDLSPGRLPGNVKNGDRDAGLRSGPWPACVPNETQLSCEQTGRLHNEAFRVRQW